MVIDFHAHAFPDARAPSVMDNMDRVAGIPRYADGTVKGLLKSMDLSGVGLSVVSRITTVASSVPEVNDWLASLRTKKLEAAATLHPDTPDLFGELNRIKALGFHGLKLHPDYQGFHVYEKRMFPLYDAIRGAGLWILFHAGLDRGLPGAPLRCTPRGLKEVHDNFPGLTLIAAHMGGEGIYDETEEYLVGTEVYLDTSFVLRKMPEDTLKRMVKNHTTRRIIYGSDTPWSDQSNDIGFLRSRPYLSETDVDCMVRENALKLLGRA